MKVLLRLVCVIVLINLCPLRGFGGTYIWTGGTSTDWTTSGNWSPPFLGNPLPSSGDDIVITPSVIGLIPPARYPIIKVGENIICNSITFSDLTAPSITVNGTLTVNSNIQQNHPGVADVNTVITGTGTIICLGTFIIGDTTMPNGLLSGPKNTTTVKCNIRRLLVTGAITVNSASSSTKTNNAALSITNDNGSCLVSTSGLSVTTPGTVATRLASVNLDNSSTGAITLKLTGTAPISITSSPYGSIDFVTGSGGGTCTVEYAGGSAQTVYTDNTQGLNISPSVYQNIRFSGAGTKTANGNNLTIAGSWASSGGNVVATSPLVIFQGGTQTLTDTASVVTFKNINFTGGAKTISGGGSGSFSVSTTGLLTMDVSSSLTMDATGKLILMSDASSSASVAPIPSTSSIVGNVNVQRFFNSGTIATNTRNYRLLSSPVNAGTISGTSYYTLGYLNNNPGVFIAGPGGPANGFTVANAAPTMYLYKESLPASSTTFNSGNFKGIANIAGATTTKVYNDAGTTADVDAPLYVGNGYMLYYAGNNTVDVTSTTQLNKQFRFGGNYINPDAATATAVGTLNQGDIQVKLWATGSTTLSNAKTGYNLVGNPYASSIDWDTFSNSSSSAAIYGPNVGTTIYTFNYRNKNYGTYQAGTVGGIGNNNGSRYIASGQGFFVVAGSAAALTFKEAAKTIAQPNSFGPSYLLMGLPAQAALVPQLLRFKLAKDSVNTDETMVLFEGNAQNSFEKGNDALRLNGIGNIASLATYAVGDAQQLAINHLHSIDSTTRVKLYINSSAGANTLSVDGLNSLDPRYDAYLLDHFKNDSIKLSQSVQYTFNIRTDSVGSFGADRFEMCFHKKSGLSYYLVSLTGKASKSDIEVKWVTTNEQNLTSFTLEKSDGAGNFITVYSTQSNSSGTYTWLDKTPRFGLNNYRLKQSDAFDRVTYTPLSIYFNPLEATEQVVMAYPNPATTQFSIKLNVPNIPAEVTLKVFHSSGQQVINNVLTGNNIQQSVAGLMPGAYIVEVSDNATKKLIGRVKITKP